MKISKKQLSTIIKEEIASVISEMEKLDERGPYDDKRGPEEEEPLEEEETLEEDEDALEEDYDLRDPDYFHSSDRPQDAGGRSNLGSRSWSEYSSKKKTKDDRKDYGPWEEGKKLTKEAIRDIIEITIKELSK